MGIYDRDYSREQPSGYSLGGQRTMVTTLIVINVVLYLLCWFSQWQLGELLELKSNVLREPWNLWQLLTYGFVHDQKPIHIAFNMLMLFFLGREVEARCGRSEFLRLYLTMIVVAGLVWAIYQTVVPDARAVVGASGAVIGVFILFVLHNPHRTLLLMFVFPTPAWVLGVAVVVIDVLRALNIPAINNIFEGMGMGKDVAWQAHLAGAAFAFLYFRGGWNLGRLTRGLPSLKMPKRRPQLKVHDPDARERQLDRQADAILEKISREGEGSLTRKERMILEDASRRAQRRRGQ